MTYSECIKIENILQKILSRVKVDKTYSKELLKKTGIYNEDGNISERYNK